MNKSKGRRMEKKNQDVKPKSLQNFKPQLNLHQYPCPSTPTRPQGCPRSEECPFECVFGLFIYDFLSWSVLHFCHCVGCSQESLFVFLAVARSILTCVGCSQPFLPEILRCSQTHLQLPLTSFPFVSFHFKSSPNSTPMWPPCLALTTYITIKSIPNQSWQIDSQIFTCKLTISLF